MIRKLHGATAAALLLACAGCAPGGDRPTEFEGPRGAGSANATPGFTEAGFIAADGAVLPLRRWLPEGAPRAVILALHGFNDYSHAFADAGAAWAQAGIATYAYDQRGFGAAPQPGRWPGRARLAADAATASAVLRARYPGRPLYLLGDSMGAAVAIVAMTGESGTPIPDIDGLILVAPAVWSRSTMGLLPRLALFVGSRLLPAMTLSGRALGIRASDNEPMLRALGRDPLVIKETRVDTVYGLADLMDAALAAAPKLDRKLLLLYGEHDEIIPKVAMRRFAGALPAAPRAPRRLAWYRNGWHMLLRDLEAPWVWADVASWIGEPGAPLPSTADRGAAAEYGLAPDRLAARAR